eukprot:6205106-Pleurochrysis_carterae.AAC.1
MASQRSLDSASSRSASSSCEARHAARRDAVSVSALDRSGSRGGSEAPVRREARSAKRQGSLRIHTRAHELGPKRHAGDPNPRRRRQQPRKPNSEA